MSDHKRVLEYGKQIWNKKCQEMILSVEIISFSISMWSFLMDNWRTDLSQRGEKSPSSWESAMKVRRGKVVLGKESFHTKHTWLETYNTWTDFPRCHPGTCREFNLRNWIGKHAIFNKTDHKFHFQQHSYILTAE